MRPIILRRRKLGRTSCREIAERSIMNISHCRNWIAGDQSAIYNADVVIRWGCTSTVNTNKVLNTSEAIHQVNNKRGFRMLLNEHALCPPTWESIADWYKVADDYPTIVARPASHSRGRNLLVYSQQQDVDGSTQLDNFVRRFPNYYLSELINKVAEYRVFVVQGRAVAVARKTPGNPDDVAWNVAQGGRFDNVRWGDWPLKAVRVAIEAFNLSSLDFGGVDVMVDGDGDAYVIEINSAPSLTSPYRQGAMSKAFDYILSKYNNGSTWQESHARIPLVNERGGWRKFIHPALSNEALTQGD